MCVFFLSFCFASLPSFLCCSAPASVSRLKVYFSHLCHKLVTCVLVCACVFVFDCIKLLSCCCLFLFSVSVLRVSLFFDNVFFKIYLIVFDLLFVVFLLLCCGVCLLETIRYCIHSHVIVSMVLVVRAR